MVAALISRSEVWQANQTMGLTYSADYPLHADPDSTDTLNTDLTESTTTLTSFGSTQQNQFQSLCLVTPAAQ